MAYLWELREGASHQPGRRREPHREAGKRRASGAARSGSEPARSSCGGGSLEAAQHSRTGEQGRPGSGATAGEPAAGDRRSTAGRVAGRSPWLGSPPPRLSRVASASRSLRRDESRGEAVRAARDFFFMQPTEGSSGGGRCLAKL